MQTRYHPLPLKLSFLTFQTFREYRSTQETKPASQASFEIPPHASHCTVFPDDAVSGGLGSPVIRHRHRVHAAVLSAVSINLKRGPLLLHVHTDIGPRPRALGAVAGAGGQRLRRGSGSSFGFPFPGYQGDLFQGPRLDAGSQNQTRAGDDVQRLLVEDVHRHTRAPTWH